ncbi:MAG: histidine--tRNA ligase [Flavobacteriales bacterium]|nr:histidine--tRNA ligase [Flavobacteriales bacterium]
MMSKSSIPKGTRDFGPKEMVKRNYIFDAIRFVFQKYGYLPIETPAMEKTETLLGKYGEEGDRLIFKILKRGASLEKDVEKIRNGEKATYAEEALRYDLTVPFARYVVQNQNDISFPFKRHQIQPVWRADRPQKGRYREFYQCDVDVIGSNSLLNEVELVQIMDEVFGKLNISTKIKLNNRKILAGITEIIGESDRMIDITVALDKFDKVGQDGVIKELNEKGISSEAIAKLGPIFDFTGTNESKLEKLEALIGNTEAGKKGIEEIKSILEKLSTFNFEFSAVEIDITLARGLNYYTGAIFEVVCNEFPSSICGGGRYDDLTGVFGLKDVSGVGVSFGADRIYDVMEDQNLFPQNIEKTLDVLFVNFGEKEAGYCLGLLAQLRANEISSELYPDSAKMKKQMKYANEKGARKVVMIGETEMAENKLTVKDMETGEQSKLTIEQLIHSCVG